MRRITGPKAYVSVGRITGAGAYVPVAGIAGARLCVPELESWGPSRA